MKIKLTKTLGVIIALVMVISLLPVIASADTRIPVEKIVIRLTSGSIATPSYGDTVVHPTFEILETVPAAAKSCYKIKGQTGWHRGFNEPLQAGDTFDEDTYRIVVYIGEKTNGAGDAYKLTPAIVYLLHDGVEQRLYNSACSNANTFNYISTCEVEAPSDITPTITTTSFEGNYIKGSFLYKKMEARGSKPITWSALGLPSGVSINSSTGEIVGYPKQNGFFNVRVTATNHAGSTTKSFVLHVKGITQKVKVKSIICDFDEEGVCVPVNGRTVINRSFKVVSAEPAEAMESIRISGSWIDSSDTLLNATNSYELGEYKLSLRFGALDRYELAEDCAIFFGSTPVTVESFLAGQIKGHVMFNTVLSQKPTNLSVKGTYTFNGKYQIPNITGFDTKTMQLVDTVRKNAGTYTATVKPWYKWADGTNDEITLDWTIEPFNITTQGAVDVTVGKNKYTGYEQEVNVESVKATIDGNVYTLERGVDYIIGGDCTRWTNVGLAGNTTNKGFDIRGIGNYTGMTPNQFWVIDKGDQVFPELIIKPPQTPGGKGTVIGTTTDMVYQKITALYPSKCTEGSTELYPGKYAFKKNENDNYNAVAGGWITIPEYDPESVSRLEFSDKVIIATNKSGTNATCIIALYGEDELLLDIKTFAVDTDTIVTKNIEELGITESDDVVIKAMLLDLRRVEPLTQAAKK